ncbi:uncharacterized protein ARMOST_20373 [Armillaria ostoyae]|uniref:Uncharacterized protein n=1 Tax=Armillaria ostoyae TaxID=47428 RepID=A0A284S773_ARMOS|nr:uncharacterized protein ARMOST_20373 [Armillaria ostoyae]
MLSTNEWLGILDQFSLPLQLEEDQTLQGINPRDV